MSRGRTISLAIVVLLISSSRAHAILYTETEAYLEGPCAWASVVRLKTWCTGTLITSDSVLTAAHCETPNEAKFGETDLDVPMAAERSVDLVDCERHHNFIPSMSDPETPQDLNLGPDLMVCKVDELGPSAPNVPTIPIMVPTGPARDWLQFEMYGYWPQYYSTVPARPTPEVVMVGAGCNVWDDLYDRCGDESGDSGNKLQGSGWLKYQIANDDVSTRLYTTNGLDEEFNPLEMVDTIIGDSGGPEFLQMRDGSWVQIGVLHGGQTTTDNEHEAAPSYLPWIEQQTSSGNNDTTTPCHDLVDGKWVWLGDCEDTFPLNPGESYESDWTGDCADVDYGGGLYPSADNIPSSPSQDKLPPGEGGGSPLVPLATLDVIYPTALSKALNGDFGTPATQAAIVEYFFDEITESENAVFPFLGGSYGAGNFGLFDVTVIEGNFDGDSSVDTVFAYPYGDCGEGTLFQVLDDGSTSEWNRDTTGILGTAVCGDHFGAAVAVGDFNNDGKDDLAVSAPGSDVGSVNQAGSVSIIYGSTSGLTDSGDQIFDQDSSGISDSAEEHDFVGEALASGDFNCDGFDDLAIGAPREDDPVSPGVFDAGAIIILWGSTGGITTSGSGTGFQGVNGVDGSPDEGDHFGAALASGNFNGDSASSIQCDDLAIGIPFEDVGAIENAGRIYIVHGGSTGLTTTGDHSFTQDTTDVAGTAQDDDLFGTNLTVEEDGALDGLSVQIPRETCSTTSDSVSQHRFYGASGGGLSTSTDVVNCEAFDSAFSSYHWGVRDHAVDYYAIRIMEEL